MRKRDVIKHFGSQKAAAEALAISQPAVAQWPSLIPEKQALRLHMLTGGQLTYRPGAYLRDNESGTPDIQSAHYAAEQAAAPSAK